MGWGRDIHTPKRYLRVNRIPAMESFLSLKYGASFIGVLRVGFSFHGLLRELPTHFDESFKESAVALARELTSFCHFSDMNPCSGKVILYHNEIVLSVDTSR